MKPIRTADATTPLTGVVGATIALHRAAHGLTIEELARRSSTSTGLLSQLERGIGNPSLSTLTRLAQALDIPIGAFFTGTGDEPDIVVHPHTRKRLALSEQNLTYQLLTPDLQGALSMLYIELPPGFTNERDPFHHIGEEAMLVLEGQVETHAEQRTFLLEAGDFDPLRVHHAALVPNLRDAGRGDHGDDAAVPLSVPDAAITAGRGLMPSLDVRSLLLSDAQALMRIRSANPPGRERPVAEWIAARLGDVASDVCVVPLTGDRANVVATFDFGNGPTLLLCSHTDVVPVQHDDQWEPVVRDGRLVGRGACDAKGAIAAMIGACERLAARRGGLHGRVLLACVADEESNAEGARALVSGGLRADAAIIGEPTGNLVVLGSRGAVRVAARFQGVAAHASAPAQGVNAIYAAARFILAIESLEAELNLRESMGSCSATVVDGGSKLNVVPDTCSVQVDRRLGPSETAEAAIHEIESCLAQATAEAPGVSSTLSPAGVWVDPFELGATHELAQLLLSTLDQPNPGPIFRAVTDAPHLIAAGIPTAILGPGSLDTAHSRNESVDIRELEAAVHQYEWIARAYLGGSATPDDGETRQVPSRAG